MKKLAPLTCFLAMAVVVFAEEPQKPAIARSAVGKAINVMTKLNSRGNAIIHEVANRLMRERFECRSGELLFGNHGHKAMVGSGE